jgi:hypothetical protein
MRVYRREDFIKLPAGTFYCEIDDNDGMLSICKKGETFDQTDDWFYTDLGDIEAKSSEHRFDYLIDSEENGTSYDLNKTQGGDGLFGKKSRYLVYEKKDLLELKKYIENSLANIEE